MRRIVLTLTLLSLGFAPAPFPKTDRTPHETEQAKQVRILNQYRRALDELGVKWQVVHEPNRDVVRYSVRVATPNGGWGMRGECIVLNDDLTDTLRRLTRSRLRRTARRRAEGDG